MNKPKIGAHVSTAGGLWKAFQNAELIGADCIQIFGASPRTWQAKLPNEDEIKKFKEEEKRTGIGPAYLHASYLVNLGSPNPDLVLKSIKSLSDHLKIAELVGAAGLIFHIGSSGGTGKGKSLEQVVSGGKSGFDKVP